jgi:hypothetical protein
MGSTESCPQVSSALNTYKSNILGFRFFQKTVWATARKDLTPISRISIMMEDVRASESSVAMEQMHDKLFLEFIDYELKIPPSSQESPGQL